MRDPTSEASQPRITAGSGAGLMGARWTWVPVRRGAGPEWEASPVTYSIFGPQSFRNRQLAGAE